MTVGLMMIVKNEARTLPRLAESLRGQIDHWTILDTGSTDDTRNVAKRVFDFAHGEVHSAGFNGFGPSRNKARELAEPYSDWLLWLDADETLGGEIEVIEDAEWIEIQERNGDLHYWKPRMFRSLHGFHWTGLTHEYLSSPVAGTAARSEAFWVDHHADGGSRGDKFTRDLALLQQEWRERQSPRQAFYLGRTFQDLANWAQAIYWYKRRITMGDWDEEVFYSHYCLGVCLLQLGESAHAEGAGHLWQAWGMKTGRAEPLVALAEHYRTTEQWTLAWEATQLAFSYCRAQPGSFQPSNEGLFVDITAADWKAAYEQSIAAWYTDNRERGRMLLDYLLGKKLPEPYALSVGRNRVFYL